jgi:NRAMP (natural resistance-associated macrophage protein)-like metal ion transporter
MPRNKTIEKIASIPAVTLEKTIEATTEAAKEIGKNSPIKETRRVWQSLGPGLTTGAADDDPSGIATYSQTGAAFGFNLLWLSLFTFPLMAIVQEMCARIGLVTGRGLASNIKKHFNKKILIISALLLFAANVFNIGADLGAMAASTKLLFPNINFALLVFFFTGLSLSLQIFLSYKTYSNFLKWLTLILGTYILCAISLNIDWKEIAKFALIPHINFAKEQIFLITAVLGTTVSPYLFFWQTSQEVEEEILEGKNTIAKRQGSNPKEIKKMRADVWTGMFFSNLIMFFIILTCGATLFKAGITNIKTAADAALALKPLAGNNAYFFFCAGIIGTGLLAVPVLAGGASYAFAETFGWKEGLYYKLKQASAFYGIIIFAMVLGLILNFVGLDPIRALIYSAMLNGLLAPLILIFIVKLSSSEKVMGAQYKNGKISAFLGWLITGIMGIIGLITIYLLIF